MACIDAFMDNDIGALACVPGNPDAHDGDPCEDFGDCNRASICDRNRFNNPGGYCRTIGCTVGDDASCAPGGDGTCRQEPPPFPNQCYDQCTTHADCRQDEGYRCSNGVAGATAGPIPDAAAPPMPGVCRFAPPKYPGAPCAVDTDCGPAPWECLTGPSFPGGYCGAGTCDPTSIDLSTCPYTATCWGPTPGSEWCVASCGCRTGEGYACVDLGGGATGCLYVGGGGPLDAGP